MRNRDELRKLRVERARESTYASEWDGLRERAKAHRQGAMLVHALGLTADQLRAAQLHDIDPMVAEALTEISEKLDGADRLDVLEMYSTDAALSGLRDSVRGTVMELEVEKLIADGDLELPDGATTFHGAEREEPGADGWFLDEDGEVVQEIQMKASDDAQILLSHLRQNPDVTEVYTTSEAAEAADRHGLADVTDTGIENAELVDRVGGELSAVSAGEWLTANVPLISLGIVAVELARNLHRGLPLEEARAIASRRLGVTLSYSAIAWMVAAFSGIEAARIGVVLTGEGSRWIVRRMSQELEPSILHVQEQRAVLASLA